MQFPVARFLWCLLLMTYPLRAQIPGMRKYTQLDGYKATTGYTILQDEKGYLWLGTDNGGVRFDGKTFKDLQAIHQSAGIEILVCAPLAPNYIAMVPLTGDIFILDHDTVINSTKDPRLKKEATRQCNIMTRSVRTGQYFLWDGIIQDIFYKFDGKKIKRFPNRVKNFSAYSVMNDCVVGMETNKDYLGFYDVGATSIQLFYHTDGTVLDSTIESPVGLSCSFNKLLTYEHKKQLLHIYEWNGKGNVLTEVNSLPLVENNLSRIYSSCSKQRKQYFFYNLSGSRFAYCEDVTNKNLQENLLYMDIQGTVKNFHVDDHNNIWLSSSDNALYFLSAKHANNARLASHIPLKSAIPRSISGVGRQLCISYPNRTTLTLLSPSGPKHFKLNDHFNSGPRAVEALNDSSIFFYESDIGILNIRTNKITYLNEIICVKDVCLYKKTGFLVASCQGVALLEKSKGDYNKRAIFGIRSTAVKVAAQGHILIGTTEGLYVKQGLDAKAVKVSHPLLEKEYVTDLLLLDDSNSLIGTNAGLFLYHPDGKVRALNGLTAGNPIAPHIRELYKQNSNTYWASTDEGACMITFDHQWQVQSVKRYTFYEGLPSNNVTSVYTWLDTAYIATAEGLGIIPLRDSTIIAMAAPRLYIDVLQAGPHSFSSPEGQVKLPDDKNELRIMLNAISYESLGNIQYYYRLNPLQSGWIRTTEPEVRFTRLPPGAYVFEAFATNAKGVKSTTVRLEIYIRPAYWQTVYFKTALALFASGILFLLIRYQLKRTEKKRYLVLQQKKHLAELELEAIKAQINPHFIYNCLNSIQYLNYKADYEQAQLYLGMFSRLIRMTLQYSQKIFIPVNEEVVYLSAYLQMEQLRFKEKLQYSIDVDDRLEKNTLIPAMLLQPYVENALKHGIAGLRQGGTISISFRKESENIEIIIKDNGPGFSIRKSAHALGLRLSATRAQTYNELFNMHITVQHYNEQDIDPQHTGAAIRIVIKQIRKWKDQLHAQSS